LRETARKEELKRAAEEAEARKQQDAANEIARRKEAEAMRKKLLDEQAQKDAEEKAKVAVAIAKRKDDTESEVVKRRAEPMASFFSSLLCHLRLFQSFFFLFFFSW